MEVVVDEEGRVRPSKEPMEKLDQTCGSRLGANVALRCPGPAAL